METRVRAPKFDYIRRKGFRLFHVLNNYEHHSNGRLWVIWNKASLRITALSSGNQWIHIQVEDPGCATFQVFFVYGLNSAEGRYDLWTFLQHIRPHHPWVCLGDFNCVRKVEERISDTVPNLQAIDDFNEAVYGAGLEDSLTHGCNFTWTNKQEHGDRKWIKLDRVLVNSAWQTIFTSSYADALAAGVSYHSPLVVWGTPDEPSRPKQFRCFDEEIILSGTCLEDTHAAMLISDVTEDEIHDALFSIDVNKSPGPDGFSSGFFRQAWSVIKGEFVKVVHDFFRSGKLLKEINSTIISLIPKGDNPSSVQDYRPISCCSTI
ncbi:uncharacterized protein LOC141630722 [Silene latifolia]|uniref:uncharacterized protein LOC141630722 n=1 Tax=Silene latifolia TaxID=37657 RepID=UPI003D77F2AE